MIAYKLFREMKDGTIKSLFIDKTKPLPLGVWLEAESHPTKGFAYRPGWHCTDKPYAPHLSMKGRVWHKVYVSDYEEYHRPANQGGVWLLAESIKIMEEVVI